MPSEQSLKTLLFCGIAICLGITCIISLIPIPNCKCEGPDSPSALTDLPSHPSQPHSIKSKHRLAIIVPFRDRFDELLEFVPHMTKFLAKQHIENQIFVMNQKDSFRFNRASLINVGFLVSKDDFDYIAMHDVDLLPLNDNLKYDFPKNGPLHIASPEFHPKYHYESFVGGILLVRREHFQLMNGMSNQYWGWGLEDDEFFVRIKDAGLKITRSANVTTGTANTFRHYHDMHRRKRDVQKCFNQKEMTRRRDRKTGLSTLKYKIDSVNNLTIDGVSVAVNNVILECDKLLTPWCDCSDAPAKRK